VKTVAAHTFSIESIGNRISVCNFRMMPVKGGIEARDLQQVRLPFQHDPYGRDIVRLVERRKRHEPLELIEDPRIDQRRLCELDPPVHNPMSDRNR